MEVMNDHAQCPQGPGWSDRTEDCPIWCVHHYDSLSSPPVVEGDEEFRSHVGEWEAVADTEDGPVLVRYAALKGIDSTEPLSPIVDLCLSSGADVVSLLPAQVRRVIDALTIRLAYLGDC
jgi:hypothetical protein